jgi:hypothetical protein
MKIPRYNQSLHFSELDSYISVLHAFFFLRIPEDHNTYFLSSPVCQTCLIDLYRKMTDQFRPELFDDSVVYEMKIKHEIIK